MPLVDLGAAITQWLRDRKGDPKIRWPYHPRSNDLGDFVRRYFLADLLGVCQRFEAGARSGDLVCDLNVTIEGKRGRTKKLDALVGEPEAGCVGVTEELEPLRKAKVKQPLLTVETKACMTAHRQATTRLVDELLSSLEVVKAMNPKALCVASVVINVSPQFTNPTHLPGPNQHRDVEVERLFERVLKRVPVQPEGEGYDGLAIAVVDFDNETRIEHVDPRSRVPADRLYAHMVTSVARHFDALFAKPGGA